MIVCNCIKFYLQDKRMGGFSKIRVIEDFIKVVIAL